MSAHRTKNGFLHKIHSESHLATYMSSEGRRFTSCLVYIAGLSQVQLLEYAIFVTITEKLHSYRANAYPILTLGGKIMVLTRLLFQIVMVKIRSHKLMNENKEI